MYSPGVEDEGHVCGFHFPLLKGFSSPVTCTVEQLPCAGRSVFSPFQY